MVAKPLLTSTNRQGITQSTRNYECSCPVPDSVRTGSGGADGIGAIGTVTLLLMKSKMIGGVGTLTVYLGPCPVVRRVILRPQ